MKRNNTLAEDMIMHGKSGTRFRHFMSNNSG